MKLEGECRADRGQKFRGHGINYTHMGRNSARGGHTAEVTVLSFRGGILRLQVKVIQHGKSQHSEPGVCLKEWNEEKRTC